MARKGTGYSNNSRDRLNRYRKHACYICGRSSARTFRSCPWPKKDGSRCGSRAFYTGIRPTSVFCPADDPLPGSASWDALLKITGPVNAVKRDFWWDDVA